ncbi:hypothetical protein OH77DRAFT_548628 [Trametes cingulata]|nr:hypothetical protein OH77DRAFT_548628 [Trametes cingulata]
MMRTESDPVSRLPSATRECILTPLRPGSLRPRSGSTRLDTTAWIAPSTVRTPSPSGRLRKSNGCTPRQRVASRRRPRTRVVVASSPSLPLPMARPRRLTSAQLQNEPSPTHTPVRLPVRIPASDMEGGRDAHRVRSRVDGRSGRPSLFPPTRRELLRRGAGSSPGSARYPISRPSSRRTRSVPMRVCVRATSRPASDVRASPVSLHAFRVYPAGAHCTSQQESDRPRTYLRGCLQNVLTCTPDAGGPDPNPIAHARRREIDMSASGEEKLRCPARARVLSGFRGVRPERRTDRRAGDARHGWGAFGRAAIGRGRPNIACPRRRTGRATCSPAAKG